MAVIQSPEYESKLLAINLLNTMLHEHVAINELKLKCSTQVQNLNVPLVIWLVAWRPLMSVIANHVLIINACNIVAFFNGFGSDSRVATVAADSDVSTDKSPI